MGRGGQVNNSPEYLKKLLEMIRGRGFVPTYIHHGPPG